MKTWRMILSTLLQALGLALLWTVKEIKAIAFAFPFFVVLMIPFRYCLKFVFTEMELDMVSQVIYKVVKVAIISFTNAQLDGAEAGKNLSGVKSDEEEKDFYAAAADCPIHPRWAP